jgi:[ribosomal protein S5]-alanine N-acetyltransferase
VSDWPVVETTRLRLRPAKVSDLSAIESALTDPGFPSDLPLARMQREGTLSTWLQRMTSNPEKTRLWAVTPRASGACVGTVALVEDKSPKTWWLAYWLVPTEWNKGLASEAVESLLHAASQDEAYSRVVAAVARSNLPSRRLLQRLGFIEAPLPELSQPVPEDHLTMQRWLRWQSDA